MKRVTRSRRGGGRRGRSGDRGSGVSDLTTERLSVYLRCLDDLIRSGVETVSSKTLAEQYHLNSAQIRKDLACFGEFGVRGVGYAVADLKKNLMRILGLTRNRNVVIVGAGNLGMALADYAGFNREGFSIVALFDSNPAKVGRSSRGGVPIHHIRSLPGIVRREKASIAVLAVPAAVAQQTLGRIERAGIKAVLNFAPTRLKARAGLTLKGVDLKIQLENLAFHLSHPGGG